MVKLRQFVFRNRKKHELGLIAKLFSNSWNFCFNLNKVKMYLNIPTATTAIKYVI